MIGRVLFALVWLIIAAGLALPLYAPDVAKPGPPAAGRALLAADAATPGCADHAGDCRSTCPRGQAVATAPASPEPCSGLIVYLVARPPPSGPSFGPQPPPPKLPAI